MAAASRRLGTILLALVLLAPLFPLAAALPDCPVVTGYNGRIHVGMDPACNPFPSVPVLSHGCDNPACCPPGDALCIVGAIVLMVSERIGQAAADRGVCLEVGQEENGHPYANLDATQPCTPPP